MNQRKPKQSGFTMIEMIMVIVIMGVIGGMVAVFMKKPVDAYFDTARRAGLSDVADTATRRMARDVGKALPNSIRNPTNQCIEFIPTSTGGRYRAELSSTGTGDILDLTTADTSFDVLGDLGALPAGQQVAVGDVVAVYNLGIVGSDAYNGDNTSPITAVSTGTTSNISITAKKFPLASGSSRFHVIPASEKIVAYVCSGGQLLRSVNHAYSNSCPTAVSIGGSSVAVMANNVASCNFVYNGSDLQRNGLVQFGLTLTQSGESVRLYHEVHVSNTP